MPTRPISCCSWVRGAARGAQEQEELIIAGRVYVMLEKENKAAGREEPWDCAADGFVFTLDKIASHVRRTDLIKRAYASK